MMLGLALSPCNTTLNKGVRDFSPPAGLGWPTTRNGRTVPQVFRRVGGVWRMVDVANPRDLVDPAIFSGPVYYVDQANGNNANTGLGSFATAVKTFPYAFGLGNATGAAYSVLAKDGVGYYQTGLTANSLATAEPTHPVAIIAETGGRVRHFAGSSETFPATTNATYTNSFVGGPTSATRVFNLLTGTEMAQGADAAAVDAALVDTWVVSNATGSSKVHIRRADGLQPTPTNTLVVRNIIAAAMDAFTGDFYVERFDFQGGSLGGILIDGQDGAKNVVLNDVTANYAGTLVNQSDGVSVLDVDGLVALIDVAADTFNWKDALNFHSNGAALMHVLALNCTGANAGKSPSTSNNGFTAHDDVISAVIGGDYRNSVAGSVVHCIEDTKTWMLGSTIEATSNGDAGTAAVKASNSAVIWLENCTITAPNGQYALHAEGGTIYTRNCVINGDTLADFGGSITSF